MAFSGSFYRQDFRLPQGTVLESPDVYVTVFNNGNTGMNVRMVTEAPPGVELVLSESDFSLPPGGQKTVYVAVRVTEAAAPGEYQLRVTAEAYREGAGIKLLGAAGQTAKLTVTGEAATVEVVSVTPDGSPIVTRVVLCREGARGKVNLGYSDTGSLKMKVAPGKYIAEAYLLGQKLADEDFSVAANENKKVKLEVRTVYFEGFSVVPSYFTETKELVFAQIVYTINNLFQPFPQAKVVLKVTRDGAPLDETSLVTFAPLEKGRVDLSYNYIAKDGWQKARYVFKLELWIEGKLYISSREEVLDLTVRMGRGMNWLLVGAICGALVLVVIIVLAFALRRRSY